MVTFAMIVIVMMMVMVAMLTAVPGRFREVLLVTE
jgi:hypothetical protein